MFYSSGHFEGKRGEEAETFAWGERAAAWKRVQTCWGDSRGRNLWNNCHRSKRPCLTFKLKLQIKAHSLYFLIKLRWDALFPGWTGWSTRGQWHMQEWEGRRWGSYRGTKHLNHNHPCRSTQNPQQEVQRVNALFFLALMQPMPRSQVNKTQK